MRGLDTEAAVLRFTARARLLGPVGAVRPKSLPSRAGPAFPGPGPCQWVSLELLLPGMDLEDLSLGKAGRSVINKLACRGVRFYGRASGRIVGSTPQRRSFPASRYDRSPHLRTEDLQLPSKAPQFARLRSLPLPTQKHSGLRSARLRGPLFSHLAEK